LDQFLGEALPGTGEHENSFTLPQLCGDTKAWYRIGTNEIQLLILPL